MKTKPTLTVAAAFALWSAAANAGAFEDAIVERYQEMGFQFIEVKQGLTQTKVEAIMEDGRKVEVIYDRATGQILKQENDRADSGDAGRSGVQYDRRGEDFLDDEDDSEDDDSDDDENDESDDDENDDSDEDDSDESDDDEGSDDNGGGSSDDEDDED